MSQLNRSFLNYIEKIGDMSFKNEGYIFIEVTKNECSDILKLASKYDNKTNLLKLLINKAKLIPIYKIIYLNIDDSTIDNRSIERFYKIRFENKDFEYFKIYMNEIFNYLEQKIKTDGKSVLIDYNVCNII
jgi:deoxyhypusine synthase